MRSEQMKRVRVGDRVTTTTHRVGDSRRAGEVTELVGGDGHERCRVKWEDGEETLVYSGADLVVEPSTRNERR